MRKTVRRALRSTVLAASLLSLLWQYPASMAFAGAAPMIASRVAPQDFSGYRPVIVKTFSFGRRFGTRIAGPAMRSQPLAPDVRLVDPSALAVLRGQRQHPETTGFVRSPLFVRRLPRVMVTATPLGGCPQIAGWHTECGGPGPSPSPPTPTPTPTPSPTPTPWPTPTPFPTPTSAPTGTPSPGPTPTGTYAPRPEGAGQRPWWTIIRSGIGGVGTYGINVTNGNLIVQAADMDIPNKDVPLNFTRAWNSYSHHDTAGSDGVVSLYGQGWTNTWDAHLSANGSNGLTVSDGMGTQYDYTADPQHPGSWISVNAGVQAILQWDGGNGYYWIQPTGVEYYFYGPDQQAAYKAFAGRLYAIYGRNHNNSVIFSYSFSGGAGSSQNITQITASAEDGRTVQLNFQKFGTYNLLASLVWPDGTTVTYNYDSAGHLTEVDEPGNGVQSSVPQGYAYYPSGQLEDVQTPNWVTSSGGAGSHLTFTYASSGTYAGYLTGVTYTGVVNFTPNDGTNSVLDPNVAQGVQSYKTITVSYAAGSTTLSDTDGHTSAFTYTGDEVTSVASNTGDTGGPAALSATINWYAAGDVRAHLVRSVIDVRGNETDFNYDSAGDLTQISQPLTATSAGTIHPTTLTSYDAYHNIIAACDPVYANAHGLNWSPGSAAPAPSSATPCPLTGTGQVTLTYTNPSYEPYGELSTVTDAAGYTRTLSYSAASQGGQDYGLPTQVTGTAFSMGGANFTPTTTYVYDRSGNVVCSSEGSGHWYAMQYDLDGRMLAIGDPDDHVVNGAACGKTQGPYASAWHYAYYANGELAQRQNPIQFAQGKGDTYVYDADGNLVSQTTWFNNVQAVVKRVYDGADRLVEVLEPQDATYDFYPYPWLTRYLYDLSQNGTKEALVFNGAPLAAHGNQYKTQRWIGAPIQNGDATPLPSPSWTDVSALSYDAMDRLTGRYTFQSGTNATTTFGYTYDQSANSYGLVSSANTFNFTYDPLGHVTQAAPILPPSFPHQPSWYQPAANRNYTYDPDGRRTSAFLSQLGLGSWDTFTYTYDAAGRLATVAEPTPTPAPSGTPVPTNPTTYSYSYYPNGWLSGVSFTSSALQGSLAYTYRDDGLIAQQTDSLPSPFTSGSMTYTYTNGGRLTQVGDPITSRARQATYDVNGGLASVGIPAGQYTNLTYDLEGEILQFKVSAEPYTYTFQYSDRGELVGSQGPFLATSGFKSADGFLYPGDQQVCAPYGPSKFQLQACGMQVTNFDARTNAPLGNTWTPSPAPSTTPWPYPTPMYDVISYDDHNQAVSNSINGSVKTANTYDMAGHLIETSSNWGLPGPTYAYHATEQLAQNDSETLHWLGASLLYTSNTSGVVDDLKAYPDSDTLPQDPAYAHLTMWDRDLLGYAVSAHNATGTDAWSLVDPYDPCNGPFTMTAPSTYYRGPQSFDSRTPPGCTAGLFFQQRVDSITDGEEVFQGARVYSPSTATWLMPDPAMGNAMDPLTQLPYAYDNNNPAMFTDPTGMAGTTPGQVCPEGWYAVNGGCVIDLSWSGFGGSDWWVGDNQCDIAWIDVGLGGKCIAVGPNARDTTWLASTLGMAYWETSPYDMTPQAFYNLLGAPYLAPPSLSSRPVQPLIDPNTALSCYVPVAAAGSMYMTGSSLGLPLIAAGAAGELPSVGASTAVVITGLVIEGSTAFVTHTLIRSAEPSCASIMHSE
jgi:RHS repeat-associated protein